MPELPEIETIKRGLEAEVLQKRIVDVELLDVAPAKKPRGQFYGSKNDIEQFLIGSKITQLHRRAKVLLVDLSSDYTLMFHLKMTGQLIHVRTVKPQTKPGGKKWGSEKSTPEPSPSSNFYLPTSKDEVRTGGGHPTKSLVHSLPDDSTRTIFTLENGSKLYFNDQRKFGWIKLLPTSLIDKEPFFQKVGPEPFSIEWNDEYLQGKLIRRTQAIKTVLLDQQLVAGIGNIYADEALNLAKVHPKRKANTLTKSEITAVVKAVPQVMNESIARGGTSFSDYVNHLGTFGDYLQNALVFKREGQQCKRCGHEIEKIKLNGRGTHYCPRCQQ